VPTHEVPLGVEDEPVYDRSEGLVLHDVDSVVDQKLPAVHDELIRESEDRNIGEVVESRRVCRALVDSHTDVSSRQEVAVQCASWVGIKRPLQRLGVVRLEFIVEKRGLCSSEGGKVVHCV
jgi:hypothetical protein